MADEVSKVARTPGVITLTNDVLTPFQDSLWRVYYRGGSHPAQWNTRRDFGPIAEMRFDPHVFGKPRWQPGIEVYYAATTPRTALAETFNRGKAIDRLGGDPAITEWVPTRPLTLVDLTSTSVTKISVAAVQMTGTVARSRAFARELYKQHGGDIDGIYSRSSVNNGSNVILFSRAASAFPLHPSADALLTATYSNVLVFDAASTLGWAVV